MKKLNDMVFEQLEFDPCHLIGNCVMAVIYVNDILMWSTNEIYTKLEEKFQAVRVKIEEEEDATGSRSELYTNS